MTGAELAKAYHNAVSTLADGYGHVLEVLSTENAALRMRVAQLEGELDREKVGAQRILDRLLEAEMKFKQQQGNAMNPGDVGE